ncbi:sn-glycerol-1-phosphate dehydrogenase [Halalkalibacter sp. AB-rgal2]|uniref:sn-glycerol-1-phosphate dehydrogenase n=1 Tax=Halalkalibacter sp. AB-rgal2 TaxID=3242695 RepID=UPI00359D95C4
MFFRKRTFIENRFLKVMIVYDERTKAVAGDAFLKLLDQTNVQYETCKMQADHQGDVIADEKVLGQLLIEASIDVEAFVAIGAGTIHDVTRFVSYKMKTPFISIPTAPSVDWFNSMGAPIVQNGVKVTFQTQAPIAVFADIDVLMSAPKSMVAAGFGDVLGKVTSLFDWQFGYIVKGEPFCPVVFEATEQALISCVENVDFIAEGQEKGIKVLMEALILSGLAMLLFGKSHPASGAEHHLSHYWEMEFLKEGRKQLLHGAKVGAATIVIASLYKKYLNYSFTGDGIIASENEAKIKKLLQGLIEPTKLQDLINRVGGKTAPADLGISQRIVDNSLQEAHLLRERYTLLYYNNVYKKETL